MKKWIALALVLMLVLSVNVPAYADTIGSANGSATGDVTVEVNGYDQIVYAVTIDWTALNFTYNFEGWDTKEHYYIGEWQNESAAITVTNDSNIAIVATAETPVDKDTGDGVTFSLVGSSTVALDIGDSGTFTIQVGGKPDNKTATYSAASVKVSITNAP